MSTTSEKTGHECLHYDSEEETSNCSCGGFIGFNKRNQVFDYSYSTSSEIDNDDHDDDDDDEEEELEDSEELFEINFLEEPLDTIIEDCESSVFSLDLDVIHNNNIVYVAVGESGESSMEALSWTLKHAVTPSTTVCLVHVFPQIRLIPSPLGKLPRSHVNSEYVNIYLNQQKGKRKLLIKKFIDLCVNSKVKVEVKLIEGDNVAKAIVDLVGNLSIRKLVIGTAKSNSRKPESRTRRRNGIADKVLKNAPESCDVKIIREGREVIDEMIGSTSSHFRDTSNSIVSHEGHQSRSFVPLMRYMPNPIRLFRRRFLY